MVNKRKRSFNKNHNMGLEVIDYPKYFINKKDKENSELLRKDEIEALLRAISIDSDNPKPINIYPKGFKQSYLGYYQPQLIHTSINYIENDNSLIKDSLEFFKNDSDYKEVSLIHIDREDFISLNFKNFYFLIFPKLISINEPINKHTINVTFIIYIYDIESRIKDQIKINIDENYSIINIINKLSLAKLKQLLVNMIKLYKTEKK